VKLELSLDFGQRFSATELSDIMSPKDKSNEFKTAMTTFQEVKADKN